MTLAHLETLFPKIGKAMISGALGAALMIGSVTSNASAASQRCGNREVIVKTLDTRFKENRQAMGLASSINLLEVFVSKHGTWTIISTRANGIACIVAAGKSWMSLPANPKGDAVSYSWTPPR